MLPFRAFAGARAGVLCLAGSAPGSARPRCVSCGFNGCFSAPARPPFLRIRRATASVLLVLLTSRPYAAAGHAGGIPAATQKRCKLRLQKKTSTAAQQRSTRSPAHGRDGGYSRTGLRERGVLGGAVRAPRPKNRRRLRRTIRGAAGRPRREISARPAAASPRHVHGRSASSTPRRRRDRTLKFAARRRRKRRYRAEPHPLDFYLGFDELAPLLGPLLSGGRRNVLLTGCGASELGARLCDGDHAVTCVDASHALVRHMRERYGHKANLEYRAERGTFGETRSPFDSRGG